MILPGGRKGLLMDARTFLADLQKGAFISISPLTAESHHCSPHLHPHKETDNKILITESSGHSLQAPSSFTLR